MDILTCIMLLLFTFTFVQSLRSLLARSSKTSNKKFPPGPYPLPIIGNLLEMGENPHRSLAKLATTHGPIMSLKLGQVTTVVISSSDFAKEVLLTYDHTFSNRSIPDALTALDHRHYSLAFLPVSPRWRTLKKICNEHLFAIKVLDASQELRRSKIQELLSDIHDSSIRCEAVEIGSMAFKTAINLLSNTIFSVDLIQPTGTADEFKDLVTKIMKEVGTPNLADFFPILRMVDPQGVRRRTGTYTLKILEIFRCLIEKRLFLYAKEGPIMEPKNDFLDTLVSIAQENRHEHEMSMHQIEHLILTMFVAGTDTITSTLEWAMTELVRNSKAMAKAKQELEKTIGRGKPVNESDIGRLPYLNAVIKEVFRLHPPVPFLIPRVAETSAQIGGYDIPKDAQVLVNVWAIGRDASIWDNPNEFMPERFLGSEIDVKGRNFELTPFGSGRRMCPALPLAMRTLMLMLGSLINSFDWKLENGTNLCDMNIDDKFGITIAKAQPLRVVPTIISN